MPHIQCSFIHSTQSEVDMLGKVYIAKKGMFSEHQLKERSSVDKSLSLLSTACHMYYVIRMYILS